jgi:hypothetical protein
MKVVGHDLAASNVDVRYQSNSPSEALLKGFYIREKPVRLPKA